MNVSEFYGTIHFSMSRKVLSRKVLVFKHVHWDPAHFPRNLPSYNLKKYCLIHIGDQLLNYLFNGRRKLANTLMREVPYLPINNSLCTPSMTTGSYRSEGSSKKNIIILKLYCCCYIGKKYVVVAIENSFLKFEQKWLEIFII